MDALMHIFDIDNQHRTRILYKYDHEYRDFLDLFSKSFNKVTSAGFFPILKLQVCFVLKKS